ncbi:hypothetical protein GQ457_01G024280 [Hibiscus cannabinus]
MGKEEEDFKLQIEAIRMKIKSCNLRHSFSSWEDLRSWMQLKGKGKSLVAVILRLVWYGFNYRIWHERNCRLHGKSPQTVDAIFLCIKRDISMRLMGYTKFVNNSLFLIEKWGLICN